MMTEQYKDSYQNKYRKETEQVHAPQSLIERTKAAMREEEKRLAQAVVPGRETDAKSASVASIEMTYANGSRQSRKFSVRRLAYPLTAVAALLILVSVSLTTRGLKSRNMAPAADTAYSGSADNGAVYEESAADVYEEMTAAAPAAGAMEAPMMEEEELEESAAEDMMADMAEADGSSVTQNAGNVESADAGQTNGLSRGEVSADMAAPAEEKTAEADSEALKKELAISEKEEASERKSEAADLDSFTIEKVTRRPARFNGSDAKIRRYEGKTFRVLEKKGQENTWEAYVEIMTGEGYVICGEAQSAEDFLAGAWEKLEE